MEGKVPTASHVPGVTTLYFVFHTELTRPKMGVCSLRSSVGVRGCAEALAPFGPRIGSRIEFRIATRSRLRSLAPWSGLWRAYCTLIKVLQPRLSSSRSKDTRCVGLHAA